MSSTWTALQLKRRILVNKGRRSWSCDSKDVWDLCEIQSNWYIKNKKTFKLHFKGTCMTIIFQQIMKILQVAWLFSSLYPIMQLNEKQCFTSSLSWRHSKDWAPLYSKTWIHSMVSLFVLFLLSGNCPYFLTHNNIFVLWNVFVVGDLNVCYLPNILVARGKT